MKKLITFLVIGLFVCNSFGQSLGDTIVISPNLKVLKISPHAYLHICYTNSKDFGRYPSNGLIFFYEGKAFLLDTPTSDSLTVKLIDFIQENLKLEIVGFITNDWHIDSMGGLSVILNKGIPTYANELTQKITQEKGLPVPKNGFRNSLKLKLGQQDIICEYFGPAHTKDNIVVWIPSEKILFADCMMKETGSENLGYTDDGDIHQYAVTVQKVKIAYKNVAIVIPGHGDIGGTEVIDHTLSMALKIK